MDGGADDGSADHIAVGINTDGDVQWLEIEELDDEGISLDHPVTGASPINTSIRYRDSTKTIEVRLADVHGNSASLTSTLQNRLPDLLGSGPDVYFGFTAGTGQASTQHDLLEWNLVTGSTSTRILEQGPEDQSWIFAWDSDTSTCKIKSDDDEDFGQVSDCLLRSVMFRVTESDFFPIQKEQACAVLEQSRQLCMDGTYQYEPQNGCVPEEDSNCELTQRKSCHPNAEWNCSRQTLDLQEIIERLPSDVPHGEENLDPISPSETYCTGQVVGEFGYAATKPKEPLNWACSSADEQTALQNIVDALSAEGKPLLGYAWGDLSGGQTCPYVKALVRCVLPNILGVSAPESIADSLSLISEASNRCVVDRLDGGLETGRSVDECPESPTPAEPGPLWCGVTYGEATDDYCYRIVLFGSADPNTGAHADRRAADFNNGKRELNDEEYVYLGQWNSGNLGTTKFRPAQATLPSEFVSIMEGCGFTWGGRWWEAKVGTVSQREGCDPMHFELPSCESCIFGQVPEVLDIYALAGWNISSANQDDIVHHWCVSVDPPTCGMIKSGTCQAVCTPEIANVDAALVIDSSGSMGSNDPNGHRKTAARIYVDPVSAPGDYVGVVDFDSRAKILSELLRIPEGEDTLKQQIGKIDASGGTDIGAGVLAACGVLSRSESENGKKAAILLTDGIGTWRGYENQCFVENPDWYLYAFGFGGANMAQLENIVNGTGGSAQWLPATQDFVCEFQRMRSKLAGLDPAECVQLHCNPGQTIELTTDVPPNQAQATFSTSWPGSDIVMTLTTPSGRVIDRSTEAPDVTHERGGTFEVYGVALPEPGQWQVSLYGAEVRPGGEPVTFGMTTVPIGEANNPPDVSNAIPSVSELWPANHKMRLVHIFDVTDPDGDPVTLEITGITQDEPVMHPDKTAPDGEGVGLDFAFLRAERRGDGNGRVYEISFVARDDKGAESAGTATVCVPHDQGGTTCVDDGQRFDSTAE